MSLVDFLSGLVFKLLGLNAERKKEVAAYMEGIAETLGEFAPRLREGAPFEELSRYVAKTEGLAKHFADATRDVLPEAERSELNRKLEEAFNAKTLLSTNTEVERQELLVFISKTAGTFEAAADTLRASANKFG
ncbi:MAG TPA: hypothetical protein VEC06_01780 [Paucimonas sp.]|nr:hypothetical protein [Paucimonas sp.]